MLEVNMSQDDGPVQGAAVKTEVAVSRGRGTSNHDGDADSKGHRL